MTRLAWLNGVFLAADEARISPFDRGFLFADGVYEVTAVYNGRLIDLDRHLDRLQRSLRELGFRDDAVNRAEIETAHRRLVADNALVEGYVYLEVTRGAYGGRDFVPPDAGAVRPTVFAFTEAKPLFDTPAARNGVRAVLLPDIRWGRRDIKTIQLLAQSMAKTEARARGADDAWLVAPDGFVTEAASSNAWIVTANGRIVTRNLSSDILAGVTRARLFDAAAVEGLEIEQRPFSAAEARAAAEAFTTAATGLVTPVVSFDGAALGDGKPGAITRKMQAIYKEAIIIIPARGNRISRRA